ncbi:hypothetical protein [Mucilaginibacter puniceus]
MPERDSNSYMAAINKSQLLSRVSDSSGYPPSWLRPAQYERIARAAGNAQINVTTYKLYNTMIVACTIDA